MEDYDIEDIDDRDILISLITNKLITDFCNFKMEELYGIRRLLENLQDNNTLYAIAVDIGVDISKK